MSFNFFDAKAINDCFLMIISVIFIIFAVIYGILSVLYYFDYKKSLKFKNKECVVIPLKINKKEENKFKEF